MTDSASSVFWQHVLDSANGILPGAEAFTIKAFDAHGLIPRVAVPQTTTHQAALNSSRTKPVNTKGKAPVAGSKAKQRVGVAKKRKQVETDEEEDEDLTELLDNVNPEDWSDNSDVAMEDQECAPCRSSRPKSSSTRLLAVSEDEDEDKDKDFGFGDATGGFNSDDSTDDRTWRPPGETDHSPPTAITSSNSPSPPSSHVHPPAAPFLAPQSPPDSSLASPINGALFIDPERNAASLEIGGSDLKSSSGTNGAGSTSLVWGIDRLFHPEIMKVTPEQDERFKTVCCAM